LAQETVNIDCQNYVNTSALHAAVNTGQREITESLLQRGAKADILEDMNITPVFTASQQGQTECLKLLLDSLRLSGEALSFIIFSIDSFACAQLHTYGTLGFRLIGQFFCADRGLVYVLQRLLMLTHGDSV